MLQRPLDRLAQAALRLVQPANVAPGDIRHFDEDLADRRGLDFAECVAEIGHPDLQAGQNVVGDIGLRKIDFRQESAERDHAGLATKGFEVGADEAVRDRSDVAEINVLAQRHSAAVDVEDFPPPALVGNGNGNLAVEAAWAAQGGIESVGKVGGGQDNHVLSLGEAVHQRQQLCDHPLLHVADDPLPPRRDGVDLVEKDDAWARRAASSKSLRRCASLSP